MPEIYLTQEQYDTMKAELNDAEFKLSRAREAIGEAASKGDLSENAEYDAAREDEQYFLARVAQIREKVNSARILSKNREFTGEISIGTKAVIQDVKSKEKETYIIVGGGAFDFAKGEVPYNGPFGSALCGAKVGDEVEVKVPAGKFKYKVLSVEQA